MYSHQHIQITRMAVRQYNAFSGRLDIDEVMEASLCEYNSREDTHGLWNRVTHWHFLDRHVLDRHPQSPHLSLHAPSPIFFICPSFNRHFRSLADVLIEGHGCPICNVLSSYPPTEAHRH